MQANSKGLDVHGSTYEAKLRRVLGGMSIFTLLMTIPQVLTIWVSHQAAGSLYLPGALICFPPFSVSWTLTLFHANATRRVEHGRSSCSHHSCSVMFRRFSDSSCSCIPLHS